MAEKRRRAKGKAHRICPEARAWLDAQIRADRYTIDEMLAEAKRRWPTEDLPSRSGLHRYQGSVLELGARMREIESASNALVGELGEGIGEKAGALLAQAVTTLATNAALLAHERDDVSIDDVRKLARASRDVLATRAVSMKERQEIERIARDRVHKEQSENLDRVAAELGMNDEQVVFWRKRFLQIG